MGDYPGEIEREVKDGQVGPVEGAGAGEAGVGGGADYYSEIRESVLQLPDDGFCGVDFSDADGVEPDAFFFGAFACNPAESLGPAGAVAVLPEHSIDDHGAYGRRREQICQIYQYSHSAPLLNSNGTMIF